MHRLSKICDAADWFDPEMLEVIQNELEEPARFHRKQWEFAIIFLTLKKYGLLKPDSRGLSMGGGSERVLYSLARHIQQLVVTDLYEAQTSWDCARTNDPDQFIKESKPFEVADNKLQAIRMDMRNLEFDDNTFDFCYSSCAFEHIGEHQDFSKHLSEVNRVLKNGGIYVFTTEFHFGKETIKDEHNYVFSANHLKELINASPFAAAELPDVRITPHNMNFPRPSYLSKLCYQGDRHLANTVFDEFSHIFLLRGSFPFTSISLILKKSSTPDPKPFSFGHFEESEKFLNTAVSQYRECLEESRLTLNPFSWLPREHSRFYVDHEEFFSDTPAITGDDDTIFHSDYFWLGSGQRTFTVKLDVKEVDAANGCKIQLRIHRYATNNSSDINCIAEMETSIKKAGQVIRHISISLEKDYNYAILGKIISGHCQFGNLEISTSTANKIAGNSTENFVQSLQKQINNSILAEPAWM